MVHVSEASCIRLLLGHERGEPITSPIEPIQAQGFKKISIILEESIEYTSN